jgi:hypothetical protein
MMCAAHRRLVNYALAGWQRLWAAQQLRARTELGASAEESQSE